MCGIVGWIKPKAKFETDLNLTELFKKGLVAATDRGEDATGFYTVGTGLVKEALEPKEFVKDNLPDINDERFVIGHNRMASAKYRSDKANLSNRNNAQPFESNHFVTVHNGSLNMPRIKGYEYTSDIDSESIIAYAERNSVRNALSNIDGPATVVMYDKKNKKILFWTNGERPLAICLYKGMIFFASTKAILRKMLGPKTELNIFQPDLCFTTIYEDELLEFDLQKNQFCRRGEIEQKIPKAAAATVKSQVNNTYFQPVTSTQRKPLQRGCTANPPAVQQTLALSGSAEDDLSPLDSVNGKDVKKSIHVAANGVRVITYHTK